jgi:class 3 adenylate cyclase
MSVCSSCGNVSDIAWKFCRYCGSPSEVPWSFDEVISRLIRQSNDVFVPSEDIIRTSLILRIPLNRDADHIGSVIAIQEGQKAVIICPSAEPEVIEPQTYPRSESPSLDSENSQILLFRELSTLLTMEILDLLSQDPLPVVVRCSIEINIENPATFCSEVFVDGDIYTSGHLADWIFGVIEKVCNDFIGSQVIRGFQLDYSAAEALREQIKLIGGAWIEGFGLRIGDIKEVSIYCPIGSGNVDQTEPILVSWSGGRENQNRSTRSIDAMSDAEVQTITEETVFSARTKGRAAVWERLLHQVMCTSITSILTIHQIDNMVRDADVDNLIDPSEVRNLGEMLDISSGDSWKSKAFLIQRLLMLRDHERANVGLIREYFLSEERLLLEFQHAALDMETRWNQNRSLLIVEIEQRRESRLSEVKTEQSSSESSLLLNRGISSISNESRQNELNQTVENGLKWYEQYRTIRRDDDLIRDQSEVDLERERQSLSIEKERAQLDMRLEESAQAHQHYLEKIDSLSQASIEALIALSGPEQGELLHQMSRTRALSRRTPDEILALNDAHSPAIGESLREVVTAITSAGYLGDYESMISSYAGSLAPGEQNAVSGLTLNQLISESLDGVSQGAFKTNAPAWMISRPSAIPSEVAPDGTVTLLFSDIKGSTDITERLGDRSAQTLFGVHNAIIRNRLKEFHGYEVKSMGDGFMLAFSSARLGIMCAVAIQLDLQGHNEGEISEPILVRMGLHTGEVIKEGEDYFGRNVILASRISSLAQEDQVLVSSLSKGLVDSLRDFQFEDPMTVNLKGLAGTTVVYPVKYRKGPG